MSDLTTFAFSSIGGYLADVLNHRVASWSLPNFADLGCFRESALPSRHFGRFESGERFSPYIRRYVLTPDHPLLKVA